MAKRFSKKYGNKMSSVPKLQAHSSIASLLFQILPEQPLEYRRQP